ncbi:hypothetical protein [Nocardia farcinica]|uniref:hypothetical protein n=1 Tax=Nocardia farcinica TaxID=37329 RepID=UPI0037BB8BEE
MIERLFVGIFRVRSGRSAPTWAITGIVKLSTGPVDDLMTARSQFGREQTPGRASPPAILPVRSRITTGKPGE